jgi:hypothetical protein
MLEVDRKLKANYCQKLIYPTPIYQNHSTSTATNLKIIKLVFFSYPISTKRKRWLEISAVQKKTTNSLNLERLQLSNKIKAQKEVNHIIK